MTRRGEKTTTAYGKEHQRLRRQLAPEVAQGLHDCWRCGQKIEPGEPWDLGHDDDRTVIMGPEHRLARPGCMGNRGAGWAKIGNGRRPTRSTYGPRPDW